MTKVFIALGSNIGERKIHLRRAVALIKKIPGVSKVTLSSVHETDPVGGPEGQDRYLNAVMELATKLPPGKLMEHLLAIEKKLGRERSVKNAPRTLDLDLLFYGDQVMDEPGLTVPHPRLHERAFVLAPLCELAPDWVHPVLRKTMKELLKELPRNKMQGTNNNQLSRKN